MKLFRGLLLSIPFSMGLWALLLAGCTEVSRDTNSVRVTGYIDKDTYAELNQLLDNHHTTVVLDSDGGLLAPAARIAGLINSNGADTRAENQCASACVLAFSAGRHRSIAPDARIGVHRSDGGPLVDQAMGDLMTTFGTPKSIVQAMLATPNRSVHWLSNDELKQWGVSK